MTLTRDGCLWNSFIYFLFLCISNVYSFYKYFFFRFFFSLDFVSLQFVSIRSDRYYFYYFVITFSIMFCNSLSFAFFSSFIGRSAAYDSHIHSSENFQAYYFFFFCNSPSSAKKHYPRTLFHSMTLFSLGILFQYLTSYYRLLKNENVSL